MIGGGGGGISNSIWGGGHKSLFLLILYSFKNIGGGEGGHVASAPLTPRSL